MFKLFFGNSLWHLVEQSDWITKFVLIVLLFMSIICWTVMLYKLILFRLKRIQLSFAISKINKINTIEDMLQVTSKSLKTIQWYVFSRNLEILKKILKLSSENSGTMSFCDWEFYQNSSYSILEDVLQSEESYLSVLSTLAAASPLLGLFGTVWGLVHAFIRISEWQTADIATVAPGIAEALITTLAGLIVAIPALIMFHYLSGQVKSLEKQLLVLTDRCQWIIYSSFVNKVGEKNESSSIEKD